MNPQQECLQNKFWEYILQNIVLHVKNTFKKRTYICSENYYKYILRQ